MSADAPFRLRTALLSRWHVHADDYADEARLLDGIEIAAVWDEDPARGAAWARELAVPYVDDLDALLGDASVDAVIATTPTAAHRDVLVRAAEQGNHIFSEKVLAANTADADAIAAAVDDADVKLMLSLPRLCEGGYLAAQEALDRGELGDLVSLRCRVAHDGAVERGQGPWLPQRFFDREQACGGSLMDLGAHPVYVCNRLAGEPERVSAAMADVSGRGVDDVAGVLVRYRSGPVAVIESGFANAACPFLLELHGTQGTFLVEGDRVRIRRRGEPWHERAAPAPLESPMRQWLADVAEATPPAITRRDMRDLTRVVEAAYRAADEREEVSVAA